MALQHLQELQPGGKPLFSVERLIVLNLTSTPSKNKRNNMIMNAHFIIIYTPYKRSKEVVIRSPGDDDAKITQIWNGKYIGKPEHKVQLVFTSFSFIYFLLYRLAKNTNFIAISHTVSTNN